MKNTSMLLWLLLYCGAMLAQNTTPSNDTSASADDKKSMLPQLITIDLNRNDLQFGLDLSEGLNTPNLSARIERFTSNENRQIRLFARSDLNHRLSFNNNDFFDFYTLHNLGIQLGAEATFFNENNLFFHAASNNFITQFRGFTENPIGVSNLITLGFGKGRIDFVDDGSVALRITEKLEKYKLLMRPLTEEEHKQLMQKIQTLKNRRRFVNRSYPLTELEEVQDFYVTIGAVDEAIDITAIIDDVYRYEPMIARTTGKQFKVDFSGSHFGGTDFFLGSTFGFNTAISYQIHSPISTSWQYDRGIRTFLDIADDLAPTVGLEEGTLRTIGIAINNDIHYLLDSRIRLSLRSDAGYNFINSPNLISITDIDETRNEGLYIYTATSLEYQISRLISMTMGISIQLGNGFLGTAFRAGLNF